MHMFNQTLLALTDDSLTHLLLGRKHIAIAIDLQDASVNQVTHKIMSRLVFMNLMLRSVELSLKISDAFKTLLDCLFSVTGLISLIVNLYLGSSSFGTNLE